MTPESLQTAHYIQRAHHPRRAESLGRGFMETKTPPDGMTLYCDVPIRYNGDTGQLEYIDIAVDSDANTYANIVGLGWYQVAVLNTEAVLWLEAHGAFDDPE